MTEIRVSEEPVCDFCSQPKPARMFKCSDFPMDQSPGFPELRSKGNWVACSTCGTMIDSENWDGLLLHAVEKMRGKYGDMISRRSLTDHIKRVHDLFREHYQKGAA